MTLIIPLTLNVKYAIILEIGLEKMNDHGTEYLVSQGKKAEVS